MTRDAKFSEIDNGGGPLLSLEDDLNWLFRCMNMPDGTTLFLISDADDQHRTHLRVRLSRDDTQKLTQYLNKAEIK